MVNFVTSLLYISEPYDRYSSLYCLPSYTSTCQEPALDRVPSGVIHNIEVVDGHAIKGSTEEVALAINE